MARWTQEGGVGAGAEAAHGTGGGKWFPGIWKTQGGEAGSERLQGVQSWRESQREGPREVRRPSNVHTP